MFIKALLGLSVILATPASAATKADAIHWEMVYQGLSAIDTVETIYALKTGRADEANPIFGPHPKTWKLIAAKLAFGGLHYAIVDHLANKNPKLALRVAQISVIGQAGIVALNIRFVF